jgi:hypothetical protein
LTFFLLAIWKECVMLLNFYNNADGRSRQFSAARGPVHDEQTYQSHLKHLLTAIQCLDIAPYRRIHASINNFLCSIQECIVRYTRQGSRTGNTCVSISLDKIPFKYLYTTLVDAKGLVEFNRIWLHFVRANASTMLLQ